MSRESSVPNGGHLGRRAARTTRFVTALGLVLALSAAAFSPARAETLRLALGADPSALDPAFWLSGVDRHLINNLFPKLVIYQPGTGEWEWELSAAEHFEQVDPLTFSFRLKPGLMWTNGYGEVTAEDVKYSFERHLDPELGSWNDKEFEWMEEVEVTGKYSGLIKMKRPSPEFIRSPLARVPGAIVSKKAVEEAGGTFATVPPATAGPYRIEEFVSGEKMILVRDDAWPGEHGDFDRIVMIPITDENARITAIRAGEIDWASVSPGVVPALQANMPEDTTLDVRDTLAVFWLGMSQKNPSLENPSVRQAIASAVDVDAIIEAVYAGNARRPTAFAAPGLPGHLDMAAPARDVEAARRLLAESGVELPTLQLDIVNSTQMLTAGQIVQANLAEIGISVEVNPMEEGTYWNLHYDKGPDKQLYFQQWDGTGTTSYHLKWFVPDNVWNWEYFENEDYVALLDQALTELDEEKRAELYRRMQQLMLDSNAFVFIAHPAAAILHRDSIEPGMLPDGLPVYHEFRKAGTQGS